MLKQITITFLLALILALAFVQPAWAIQNFGTEASAEVITYVQPDCYSTQFSAKQWGDGFIWKRETDMDIQSFRVRLTNTTIMQYLHCS